MRISIFWLAVGLGSVVGIGVALAQVPKATASASQSTASAPASGSQPTKGTQNLPKELVLDLGNDIKMEFILIPAGEFMMGSPENEKDRQPCEGPQHKVTIRKSFYLGKYPVTHEQSFFIVRRIDSKYLNRMHQERIAEVNIEADIGISWDYCQLFCTAMSNKTERKVRLPSEAEWEYACRAGSKTRFSYGDDPDYSKLTDFAWYKRNFGIAPSLCVGQKKPNAWGLYDMHGNVWEWCQDDWSKDYQQASPNEEAFTNGDRHVAVLRGGSYSSDGNNCRSASRKGKSRKMFEPDIGFRVVVEIPD